MNAGNLEFPERMFYEGNVTLSAALQKQIQQEDALFQFEKKILNDKANLNLRRLEYRQHEEDVDSNEKDIKQQITDFRTKIGLRSLEIQRETENLIQLENAAASVLKQIKQKIKRNSKRINEEREKIADAQNFEVTATQYNEVLQEQNQNMKNELIFKNNDYQIRAQITWYSNEFNFLDKKISRISSNLPNYDATRRSISLKIDKESNCIRQLNESKQQILRSYPQKDDIELNKKKISNLQKESKKVLNKVREYHEIQKGLVSRISYITTKCVKCDILNRKYEKLINELKTNVVSKNCFMFDKLFIDDDNERSGQIIKNNSNKIFRINESIKDHESTLKRQISDTKNAVNGHLQTIQFLKQQINEYSNQKITLKSHLSEIKNISNELDQNYQRINYEIKKLDEILDRIEKAKRDFLEKLRNPKLDYSLRPYSYELDQIRNESNIILKISIVNDSISSLKKHIDQYEKENKILQQKLEHKRKKIKEIQYNQISFYTHQSNQLKTLPNENSPIDKLKIKIENIKRKIASKSIDISKKRDEIKYKLSVISNIQKYLIENKKRSPKEPIQIKKKKESHQIDIATDLQNWINSVEKEILKWEVAKVDDSIENHLNNWDQELTLAEYYYSYSGVSE